MIAIQFHTFLAGGKKRVARVARVADKKRTECRVEIAIDKFHIYSKKNKIIHRISAIKSREN